MWGPVIEDLGKEEDSWEKWRKDASVSPCEYFGYQSTSCEGCQANNSGNCSLVMARELESRAKAIAEKEDVDERK